MTKKRSFIAAILSEIEITEKKIRDFGWVMLVVLSGIIPLFLLWRAGWEVTTASWILIAVGITVFLLSRLYPQRLHGVYKWWMALAVMLGLVMTKVIISLVFYLIMTPIGLIRRLIVGDPLGIKSDPGASTYWVSREKVRKDPSSYEKQY